MITYKYGKSIDSFRLKKSIDKERSIAEARKFSLNIKPGMDIKNCPICKSKNRRRLQTVYRFKYYECKKCGAAYILNIPSNKEIEKMYNTKYYNKMTKDLLANDTVIEYRVENIARPKVEYILKHITTSKKRWLDIGCGVGEILSVVSAKGWDVLGLETNELEIDYAVKKFGLRIDREYINKTNVSKIGNKYGVISLFGVLEHLKNPHSLIKNISSVQRINDNLVIEVPHFPSISAATLIAFPELVSRVMHPPLHLFLFSLKSLELLLNRYGYKITNAWYYGQDFYELLSDFVILEKKVRNSILYEKLLLLINDIQAVLDAHRLSDEILVISKKITS